MAMKKDKENKKGTSRSRAPMDIDKIVQTALKLMNEAGLEQLTIRRLADALGIRSASLYWHVRDKSELMQLMADNICGRLRLPDPSLPWEEQLFTFLMDYRATLLSIRDSPELLLETFPLTPKRLALMESLLKVLVETGFPPKEIVMTSLMVNDYVLSFVRNEMRMSTVAQPHETNTSEAAHVSGNPFASLPADKFPTIVSIADDMEFVNSDEHFEYGLRLLISSFKTKAEPQ